MSAPAPGMNGLNQLRKLYDEATPGPWLYDETSNCPGVFTLHEDGAGGGVAVPEDDYPRGINSPVESMRFIAHIHEAAPGLLNVAEAVDAYRRLAPVGEVVTEEQDSAWRDVCAALDGLQSLLDEDGVSS